MWILSIVTILFTMPFGGASLLLVWIMGILAVPYEKDTVGIGVPKNTGV